MDSFWCFDSGNFDLFEWSYLLWLVMLACSQRYDLFKLFSKFVFLMLTYLWCCHVLACHCHLNPGTNFFHSGVFFCKKYVKIHMVDFFCIWSHRVFWNRCYKMFLFLFALFVCTVVVLLGAALLVGSSVRSFSRPFVRLCVPVCLTRCCVCPSVVVAAAAAA